MNGMERKVAERSAALKCNGEKRKPPATGFGRKTIHGLHLRRVVVLFVVFPATMLISNRSGQTDTSEKFQLAHYRKK
jgi:hypothetical protein